MSVAHANLLTKLQADPEEIEAVKRRILAAQYASNTIEAYGTAWRMFKEWCESNDRAPEFASEQDCIDHAAWMIAQGYRLETLACRLKGITHRYRQQGRPSPVTADVRRFLNHARRDLCEEDGGKEALTRDQIRRVCKRLDESNSVRDIRDRAMLLLGFALGWRRCEIAGLRFNDVAHVPQGLLVVLRKSKTDQMGKGRVVGVPFGRRALTCPVKALDQWLRIRGKWTGPLFTRVDGPGERSTITRQRMHNDTVRRAVVRGLKLIGDDPKPYGAHSLRSGMITEAAKARSPEAAIRTRTGHRGSRALQRYIRPTTAFDFDPLRGVL